MAAVVLALFPLCIRQKLTALKYANFTSLLTISILAFVIIFKAIDKVFFSSHNPNSNSPSNISTPALTSSTISIHWFPNEWTDVFYSFPIIAVAFLCHFNVLPLHSDLIEPSRPRVKALIHYVTLFASSLYFLVGVSGYVYAGAATDGNILNNFDNSDVLINIGRSGLAFTCCCTFPLLVLPCRAVLLRILAICAPWLEDQSEQDENLAKQKRISEENVRKRKQMLERHIRSQTKERERSFGKLTSIAEVKVLTESDAEKERQRKSFEEANSNSNADGHSPLTRRPSSILESINAPPSPAMLATAAIDLSSSDVLMNRLMQEGKKTGVGVSTFQNSQSTVSATSAAASGFASNTNSSTVVALPSSDEENDDEEEDRDTGNSVNSRLLPTQTPPSAYHSTTTHGSFVDEDNDDIGVPSPETSPVHGYAATASSSSKSYGSLLHIFLTAVIMSSSFLFALWCNSVATMWNLLGSTVSIVIAYLLPAAFYLQIRKKKDVNIRKVGAWALMIMGIIMCTICSYVSITSLLRTEATTSALTSSNTQGSVAAEQKSDAGVN